MALSILDKIFIKEEKKRSFFLALEITQDIIKAALCELEEEKIGILAIASQKYDGQWAKAISAADTIISKVEENLPSKINLEKVILGLPEEFIKEGKIDDEHLPLIKELCQKLLLEPLGFVEIPLAIVNFLKKQEGGTPESLVLLRLGPKLEVVLVRVGKITNNITVLASGNLAMDLEKALQSFTGVEVLPSKILVFDGMNLETAKQELMNHPWTSRVPFLHFPRIEIAPFDLDIKSVAYAGASEMMNNMEIKIEPQATISEKPGIKESIAEEGENFGFVKDQEILVKSQQVLVTEEIKQALPKIKFDLPKFSLPKLSLPSFSKIPKMGIVLTVGFFIILIAVGLAGVSWYWPAAKVNLLLETKTLRQELEVILDPKLKEVSGQEKEIPGLFFEIDENASQKAAATGKKLVGEKAKGSVTIYNKTQSSRTFKADMVIVSSSGLKFALDNDVTVASASATDPTTSPVFGKSDVRISATGIGPEGNLGVGQIFTFTDYSIDQYVAKNNAALSGGTSREISVISRTDQENLLEAISTQLTQKAKKDLGAKLKSGEKILEETLTPTTGQKKFDEEVNQEGTELNLDLTMHFSALGYQEEDLFDLLFKNKNDLIPQGYEVNKNDLKMGSVAVKNNKDGTYQLKTNLEISFLPEINNSEIKKNLVGKSLKQADAYLRALGNIKGFEVNFQRTFFLSQNILPYSSQNIVLESSPMK